MRQLQNQIPNFSIKLPEKSYEMKMHSEMT